MFTLDLRRFSRGKTFSFAIAVTELSVKAIKILKNQTNPAGKTLLLRLINIYESSAHHVTTRLMYIPQLSEPGVTCESEPASEQRAIPLGSEQHRAGMSRR